MQNHTLQMQRTIMQKPLNYYQIIKSRFDVVVNQIAFRDSERSVRISVSRLKKKKCKYEYENFSYLEKNEI
jgi:hypothetical protein